jgi:hypothetical protein
MSQSFAICKPKIRTAINKKPNGSTAYDLALKLAAEQIATRLGDKYVLLITDGEYNKGKDIICTDGSSDKNCASLQDEVKKLSNDNVRICPIWVSPISVGTAPKTLTWISTLQKQQNSSMVERTKCPTERILDLKAEPWRLAQEVIQWYAKILEIQYSLGSTDRFGSTKGAVTVPYGTKALALIGLRGQGNDPIFNGGSDLNCNLTQNINVESFDWAQSAPVKDSQDICSEASLSGEGLAPGTNGLIALFAPARPRLASCEPDSGGGGWLGFSPGIGKLLERKPQIIWIGSSGQEVLAIGDDQFDGNRIRLDESTVERLRDKDSSWVIALAFKPENQPDAGLASLDRITYGSVKSNVDSSGAYSVPQRGVLDLVPGSNTETCLSRLVRSPLQKYWALLAGLIALVVLLIAKRLIDSQRIDLAGNLAILDGTGSRSMGSTSISGGSPSWFNVGDRGKIEPGKDEEGKNWRLRWRRGTNLSLEPADGEAGEWSEGTVKSERGRGFIEFKRVPLLGGSETNTIRYTPEEGTKMGELINKELEDPE